MLAEEAAELQELAIPVPDHPVLLLLQDGKGNILDLPTAEFYITVFRHDNSSRCYRKATAGRIAPTTPNAHPDNWEKLLKEPQLLAVEGT